MEPKWKYVLFFIALNLATINCAPSKTKRYVRPLDEEDVHDRLDNDDFPVPDDIGIDVVDHLPIDTEYLVMLARALAEDPYVLYVKYTFTQPSWDPGHDDHVDYLEEKEYRNYIDPTKFTFVQPGIGYLLQTLPFDYIPLSLASLGVHVSTVNIMVNAMTNPPFNDLGSNDTYELQYMFDETELLIRDANLLAKTQVVSLDEFSLCTDKLDDSTGGYIYVRRLVAAIMNNRYPLFQSVHDCRDYSIFTESSTAPTQQYWFNRHLPLIFGFIVFCFAPLLLVFFFRRNPPFEDDNGTMRITSTSDLPIGLKYTFLFSYNNNEWVRGFMVTIGLMLLLFLSYMQPLVAFLVSRDDYADRVHAAERTDSTGFWVYIGVMVGYYVLFLVMFLAYVFNILISDQDGMEWESDRDHQRLTFMQLPPDLWIQPVDLPLTQSMIYHARERMLMALDVRVWKYEFWRLWDWITSGPDCDTQYMCKYTFGILTYLFLLVPYGLLFLLRLFFNSLPSFYIVKQCLFDWQCRIPIGAIAIVFAALRVPSIIWYLVTLVQNTFLGLVVSPEVVLPPLIIAFSILFFGLKTYNEIYQDYIDLTKIIIDEVVHAQEKISNNRRHSRQSGLTRSTNTPTLYTMSNGMPSIELDLWYSIINEIRSVPKRFFGSFFTFFLASVALAIEFQFLWYINQNVILGVWMFCFAAVLLAMSLPLLHQLIRPGAAMLERKKAEDTVRVKSLIASYFRKNQSYDLKDDYSEPRSSRYAINQDPRSPRYITGEDNAAFFGATEMKEIPAAQLGNRGLY